MITTLIYYWHDGVLEPTANIDDHAGCSHLVVTLINGIPKSAITVQNN